MLAFPEVKQVSDKMAKHLDHLREALAGLRVGRASATLVENILVESYGAKSPLKAMAAITVPDARTIMIQPWDRNILSDIERALQESDLGITPTNTGIALRLNLPPLTEERRTELAKIVGKLAEETKVAMRVTRQEVHGQLKEQQRQGEITEDDFYAIEKALNEEIAKYNQQAEELATKKSAELMVV